MSAMLDDRSARLLRALIARYIEDGSPVGSRTLSRTSGMDLSAATVRNVMSDLEALGLIASPHTSAGRIPTVRGYRLFVDTMLTAQREGVLCPPATELGENLTVSAEQPQRVIANAAQLLSQLSHFVGVVLAPKKSTVLKHVEFLRLSQRRYLVILVSPDGDVQNRVIHMAQDYAASQLVEASNYLNAHFAGRTLDEVRTALKMELQQLQGEITLLMQMAVEVSTPSSEQSGAEVVIAGERNLLSVSDFTDMTPLRRAFDLFEQKTQLLRLLDTSEQAQGVRIFIGGESQMVPIEELSVVSAPYEVNGQIVGTLGVIGPTRMPYERMIRIVDITSKLVGNALSQAQTEFLP